MPPDITLRLLFWLPVLLVGVLLVSGWLVILGKRGLRQQIARVAQARRGGSFATFAADFPSGYAPEVLHAVYDSFQRAAASHQGIEGFVVRAEDSLGTVYDAYVVDDYNDLGDLDLRSLVEEAAAACGRRLPEPGEAFVRVKVRTVRDVVSLLARCPRLSDA